MSMRSRQRARSVQHRLQVGEFHIAVDVDMASYARRAVGDQRSDKRRRALGDRQRHAMAGLALDGDALAHAGAGDVRQTRRAPMRLVEMDVAFDESGNEQSAVEIERCALRRRQGADGGDAAVGDLDIGPGAARKKGVAEPHQIIPNRCAATYL